MTPNEPDSELAKAECAWSYDKNYAEYSTTCGESINEIDVQTIHDSFKFCPFCGTPIRFEGFPS